MQLSAVLPEANLLCLLAELLALQQDAILADQAHATAAARHARHTVALGAREAAYWLSEGVGLVLSASEATQRLTWLPG